MKKIISINFPLLKCVLSSGDHSPFPLFAECVAKEKESGRGPTPPLPLPPVRFAHSPSGRTRARAPRKGKSTDHV